jgi:hypothetical protein
MALDTAFRSFTLLPRFIHTAAVRRASLVETGNGESRKAHWLGDKRKQQTTPQQAANQGGNDRPPPRTDPRGYRQLTSLTLGEVDDVYSYFSGQLISSPAEAWVAKNYFCYLPLKDLGDTRPPAVFGRVKTCFPGDGYIDNVGQMELYFPGRDGPPDVLLLHQYELSTQAQPRSYCVGVKFYVSEEEMGDFRGAENIFIEKGFAPLYENSYLDLLEVNEQSYSSLPWLHVIGSGWFASIPDSMQAEVRQQLRNLVSWNTTVFNYHPRRYSLQYRTLNEELDLQYGFTEQYLVAPQDTAQVLKKVVQQFGEIFMQGIV